MFQPLLTFLVYESSSDDETRYWVNYMVHAPQVQSKGKANS